MGKALSVALPLVALAGLGAATGGFGLLAAPAAAGAAGAPVAAGLTLVPGAAAAGASAVPIGLGLNLGTSLGASAASSGGVLGFLGANASTIGLGLSGLSTVSGIFGQQQAAAEQQRLLARQLTSQSELQGASLALQVQRDGLAFATAEQENQLRLQRTLAAQGVRLAAAGLDLGAGSAADARTAAFTSAERELRILRAGNLFNAADRNLSTSSFQADQAGLATTSNTISRRATAGITQDLLGFSQVALRAAA